MRCNMPRCGCKPTGNGSVLPKEQGSVKEQRKIRKEVIAMKPMTCECVCLYYDRQEELYYADLLGERIDLSPEEYAILSAADGKTDLAREFPELSPRRLANLLHRLKNNGLLITKRYEGFVIGRYMVFLVANRVDRIRTFCGVFNLLLPFASLIFFACGAVSYARCETIYGDMNYFLYYLLFFLSITAHEFGHFAAAVTYRYYVAHAGVLLLFRIIPLGAYVSCRPDGKVRAKRHKVQFFLAGIEMNFLLAGLFSMLSCIPWALGETFYIAAYSNVILGTVNLLIAPMLDGGKALAAALGIDDFWTFTRNALSRRHRKRLLHSGAAGWFCLGLSTVGALAQVLLIGIILADLITLVTWVIQLL